MTNLRLRKQRIESADEGVRWCLSQLREHGFISGHGGGYLPPDQKRIFVESLHECAKTYRAAGLGLLAGRVEWLAKQPDPGAAWVKFDKLGGCGVS